MIKPKIEFCSRRLIDHETDGLRTGEGSMVALADGSLYLLVSDFTEGGEDHSWGQVSAMISRDNGETWSAPKPVFVPPEGALNIMSASLLRLQDGRIGCVVCLKKGTHERLAPSWSYSNDEGATWSELRPITTEDGYFVVNNDRLIQHEDGTLIVPYALHRRCDEKITEHWDPFLNATCGLFYSRDGGVTWNRSPHTVTYTKELFYPPLYLERENLHEGPKNLLERRLGVFQEPGVVVLKDGSLMMYIRSLYGIYRCFASAVDAPWQKCGPIEGFNVCCGPQTIGRIGNDGPLIMLYNDRGTTPYGTPNYQNRTPLSLAISEDEGQNWTHLANLEGPERNYCYYSLLYHNGCFHTTYYESADVVREDGSLKRRNLASLKYGVLRLL